MRAIIVRLFVSSGRRRSARNWGGVPDAEAGNRDIDSQEAATIAHSQNILLLII